MLAIQLKYNYKFVKISNEQAIIVDEVNNYRVVETN